MAKKPAKRGGATKRAVSKSGKGRAGSKPARKAAPAPSKSKAARASLPPKRPPEIPAKQWSKLGKSQRRRYAGFYKKHPGAPLYRARGKGAAEHLTRRQRRQERMEALAERQSYRGHRHGARAADEIMESYQVLVRDRGEAAFGTLERLIRERQKGQGRITSAELGFDWSDYGGDESELFYN